MKVRRVSPGHITTDTGYYAKAKVYSNVSGYSHWTVYAPDGEALETYPEVEQAIEHIRSDTDN
jgi:hypothetical protein